MRGDRRGWIAARIDCVPPAEDALLRFVVPWVNERRDRGLIGRWFFLWYGENGLHLRLRVRPTRGEYGDILRLDLQRLAETAGASLRVQDQSYDRQAMAFGETRESVLAELLHDATSELAIRLLASQSTAKRGLRAVLAAAAAVVLLKHAAGDRGLAAALAEWAAFAERGVRNGGGDPNTVPNAGELNAFATVVPRVEGALLLDSTTWRIVALLRRVRERGPRGRFVGTHALHLFCNELGVTFDQELCLLKSLTTAPLAAILAEQ